MIYTYIKEINIKKIEKEIRETSLGINYEGLSYIKDSFEISLNFKVDLTSEEKEQLDLLVSSHNKIDIFELTKKKVGEAIEFGNNLILDFATENTILGITKLGLTSQVISITAPIITALQTGAFHVAIEEIRKIPEIVFDGVIITPARLLEFRNKIEAFLEIELAKEWNQ